MLLRDFMRYPTPAAAEPLSNPSQLANPLTEMERAMKAAVVTEFNSPLEIQDLPIPEPGPGEVLVRIEATGLCHTDIHAAHGDWPVRPTPPFIPGHEGIGTIEKLGLGVSTRAVGDRVAIAWLGCACGQCRYCISGWETLCEKQQNSGYSVNGTFAEYAIAPAAFATPVPDAVSSHDGAPLTCAGVTTYKAIKVARVAPAETVAVFGIGGLGHLALQYARIAGGFVIGVDIEQTKLAMATELGADHVVNARTADPVEAIQALGGADVAVVLAASASVFDQAYRSLRRGGRLVCVAMPADNGTLNLPIFDTVINGKTVIGSIVGTRNDLADVFALHAAGRTKVISVERKLDEVNQSIADVLAGQVPARVVFQF
jgi:propanol-preferring alcohol dehydrogenase